MGPAAAPAFPELEARLNDPQLAFPMIRIMNQMKPGHFESLPHDKRDAAAAAIYRFITESEEAPMIRGMIAEAFPAIAGEASEPYLLKLLRSNTIEHRVTAADALSTTPFATEPLRVELLAMLQNDPDMTVRQEAAQALGNALFHSPATEAELLKLALNPPVVDVSTTDKRRREANGEQNKLASAATRSLMSSTPNKSTELAARIIDNLLPYLSPINAPQRMTAMSRIQGLGAPAIPRLIELLDHENKDVAISASVALNKMGRTGVPALAAAIREGSEQSIQQAANALWWIGRGAKDAVPVLLEIAASEERSDLTRTEVIRAALKIDPQSRESPAVVSSIPVLIRVLREGGFRDQGKAAEALGQIGPVARQALPILRERLEPPSARLDTGGLVPDYVSRQAKAAIAAIESEEREPN
jgi:HEAT repeat protein